ncbi:MAG: PH domain-containing protein [Pseudomonadota bacterium]
MAFTNAILSTSDLSISSINFTSLSQAYLALELKICASSTMALMLVFVVLGFESFIEMPEGSVAALPWAIIGSFVLGAIIFLYIMLAFPKKGYAVREHDLNYTSGLLFQMHVCQPILRIQHIEIKRGPLERKVGLASLYVYSAGGVQHTFAIPGLAYDTATRLRSFILEHRDLQKEETENDRRDD